MKMIASVLILLAIGLFVTAGTGCATGGGGGGGDDDLCADVECPDGQACNPATGQCEPVDDGDGVDGAAVYAENCAACHGADGSGGAVNTDITGMTAAQLSAGLESASHDAILLSEEEIAAIADFLSDGGDLCADVDCPEGQVCNPATGQCEPDDDDDGEELPALIKTHIIMDDNTLIMRPKAGDDLIVWGDEEGVYYIVPSETDSEATAPIEIPEGARYAWNHFAVSGKKVLMVSDLGEIRIYHTVTGESRDFGAADGIVLDNIQLTTDTLPGLTQASGDLFVTVNDEFTITDGATVKVIDVAGDAPAGWTVIPIPNPEDQFGPIEEFKQVAVDAGTRRVLGEANNDIYVWDIDDPGAGPAFFVDLGVNTGLGGVNDRAQLQFEGDYVLYHQDPDDFPLGLGMNNAVLLNVVDGSLTIFGNNPSMQHVPVEMAGGSFFYTQWKESLDEQSGSGQSFRSAIGLLDDAPASTLASQFDTYDLQPSVFDFDPITQEECFDDPKLIGYGSSACITPDGSLWFIAGEGPIDSYLDYLQMSEGGEFTDFADLDTLSGSVMATDVTCSDNVVSFRALRQVDDGLGCSADNEWVVGFIIIDRLD